MNIGFVLFLTVIIFIFLVIALFPKILYISTALYFLLRGKGKEIEREKKKSSYYRLDDLKEIRHEKNRK